MRSKTLKLSLIKKTVFLILCITIFVGTVAIAIYNKGAYDIIISQYKHYSTNITRLVAVEIDSERLMNVQKAVTDIYNNSENKVMSDQSGTPEFDAYISQFKSVKEMEDYKIILAELKKMQNELDVDCLYTYWVDVENERYVYLVDAANEDPCPPGCIDPFFMDNVTEALKDLSDGIAPTISNTPEYGWIIATGMPIYNNKGEIIAMASVDISMNKAMSQLVHFMFYIEIAFLIVTILACLLGIFLLNKFIVKPINMLSNAASDYKNNRNVFSELLLKRNDEIGLLKDSMIQMEKDIESYIDDLISTHEHASRMEHEANIDALTGVGNKRAYDIEVKRLNESKNPYGIVFVDINDLKGINDNYGHEKGDISIKTVSRTICKVFNPLSVYRIGGDEFVVILENDDYENRNKLIREISELFQTNESGDLLPPWKNVSAAVGYAVRNTESDTDVESVLYRADTAMYENKKAMKEE